MWEREKSLPAPEVEFRTCKSVARQDTYSNNKNGNNNMFAN
jgi:hypothetical protein